MQTLLPFCSGWLHPYFHWDSSWSMPTPDQQPGFVYDCKHAYNCASTALKWARDQTKDCISAHICYLTLEACFGWFRSAQRQGQLEESSLQALSAAGSRGVTVSGLQQSQFQLLKLSWHVSGYVTHHVSHCAHRTVESCNTGNPLFQAIQAEKEKAHETAITSLCLKSITWEVNALDKEQVIWMWDSSPQIALQNLLLSTTETDFWDIAEIWNNWQVFLFPFLRPLHLEPSLPCPEMLSLKLSYQGQYELQCSSPLKSFTDTLLHWMLTERMWGPLNCSVLLGKIWIYPHM